MHLIDYNLFCISCSSSFFFLFFFLFFFFIMSSNLEAGDQSNYLNGSHLIQAALFGSINGLLSVSSILIGSTLFIMGVKSVSLASFMTLLLGSAINGICEFISAFFQNEMQQEQGRSLHNEICNKFNKEKTYPTL